MRSFLSRLRAGTLIAVAAGFVLVPLSAPAQTPAPTPADTPAPSPAAGAEAASDGPLGATPKQIAALYGPVLRHNARVRRHQILEGGTVIDGDLYGRDGLVIRVVYYGGVSVLLEYNRAAGVLTADDVRPLLAATAGPSTWENGKDTTDANRFYRRADGKAVAHYAAEYDGSLLIATEGRNGNDFYGGKLLQ